MSSVDTIPVTLPSVPEELEAEPWGRLLPMARGFRSQGGFCSPLVLVLVLVLLISLQVLLLQTFSLALLYLFRLYGGSVPVWSGLQV